MRSPRIRPRASPGRNEIEMAATAVTEMSAAVDEVARNANLTSGLLARGGAERRGRAPAGEHHAQHHRPAQPAPGEHLRHHRPPGRGGHRHRPRAGSDPHHRRADQPAGAERRHRAARAGDQGRGFAVVADEGARPGAAHAELDPGNRTDDQRDPAPAASRSTPWASSTYASRSSAMASEADNALEQIAQRVSQINEMNLVIASAAEEQGAGGARGRSQPGGHSRYRRAERHRRPRDLGGQRPAGTPGHRPQRHGAAPASRWRPPGCCRARDGRRLRPGLPTGGQGRPGRSRRSAARRSAARPR